MMKRKWIGTLTQDLISLGESMAGKDPELKKGDTVIVWKKRNGAMMVGGLEGLNITTQKKMFVAL